MDSPKAITPAIELYPYQKKWILDNARFKEGRWARQTGKSFACAAGIVLECRETDKNKWVAISSGERQVKEFMEKVDLHARITEKAISWHEDVFGFVNADGHKEEYKVTECRLRNGSRIIGAPANPDTARGYSANVYLDEFSVHKNSREMWAAVFPIVSRGFKLWATYTPKGRQNMAYDLSKNPVFSHHVVDIYQAVAEGCPHDIEALRAGIDPDLWAQEYEVQFLDEATAFITYDMINECESDKALIDLPKGVFMIPFPPIEERAAGQIFLGVDIGRKKDLTVIWAWEKLGDVFWTRMVKRMKNTMFRVQRDELFRLLPFVHRCCIDSTGLGMQLAEEAIEKFGSKVEAVTFTSKVKEDLAFTFRRKFEDRLLRIPPDRDIREDIHSVKKITTSAGNIRFDAERSEAGHADHFWAGALGVHAGNNPVGLIEFETAALKREHTKMAGFLR
jgi:phage FluMu gp28-like protein